MKNEEDKDYWKMAWTRFKSGDQEAFAVFYNLYADILYRYGTKICPDTDTVKDSLQELFLELYLNREKVKVEPDNLKFYLLLALKRNLIRKLKAGRKMSANNNDTVEFEPEYSIEFRMIEQEKEAEINNKVWNALQQLPAKQKEAIYLRYNESLEYGEIAYILQISVESVRKQVHRAIKSIREIIDNESVITLFFFMRK
jgi:RNA polymerase sigma factor (sigma-70 family)